MHIYKNIHLWISSVFPKYTFFDNEAQVRPFPYLQVSAFLKFQINPFLLVCYQNSHHKCAACVYLFAPIHLCAHEVISPRASILGNGRPNILWSCWKAGLGRNTWKAVINCLVCLKIMGVQGLGTFSANTNMILGKRRKTVTSQRYSSLK